MLVHTHKVMPILLSMLVLIGFLNLVCREQAQGAPLVDPSTLGGKTLYELASLKYCYSEMQATLHDQNVLHRRERKRPHVS